MGKKILGIDIDAIIKRAINESLPRDEKQAQNKKSKELEGFQAPQKNETDEVDEDAGEEVTKKVKAADIVDLLNTMRSGKTLKDPEVRKNFQAYFDGLTGSERVALFSFSKAMADIIAGENTLEDIKAEPSPEDYGIEVSKDEEPKKTVKKSSKPSEEKDDGSAPIVVGESANKLRELKIVRRLR